MYKRATQTGGSFYMVNVGKIRCVKAEGLGRWQRAKKDGDSTDWHEESKQLKFEQKMSWPHVASVIKKKYFPDEDVHQVLEKIRSYIRKTPEYKKGKMVYEDKRDIKPQSVEEYFNALKTLNNAVDEMDTKQTNATIRIDDDKPICIAHWGDWHIGGRGIDYDRLEKDADMIAITDGLYNIKMGDYGDNASPFVHGNAVFESIASPEMQDRLVIEFFKKTAERNIAVVRGCHDDWKKRLADIDFIQYLCNLSESINLWHGGIINVKLGNQTYRLGARHKYKWESGLNTTNAQRNFINDWGSCDSVCFAHKHFPDLQHTKRMGQDVVYMRSGAYKIYDEFGQKLAGYEGQHGIPCIILFPDRHEIVPFKSMDRAIECLKLYRHG